MANEMRNDMIDEQVQAGHEKQMVELGVQADPIHQVDGEEVDGEVPLAHEEEGWDELPFHEQFPEPDADIERAERVMGQRNHADIERAERVMGQRNQEAWYKKAWNKLPCLALY